MDSFNIFIDNHNQLFLFYVFVISACVGSFLNVVIFRLPFIMDKAWAQDAKYYLQSKNIKIKPIPVNEDFSNLYERSKCPSCQQPIPLYLNIPILGWIMLRGKSACCKEPFSARYMLIELLSASCATIFFAFYEPAYAIFASLTLFTIIPLIFIDLEKQILPFEIMFYTFMFGLMYHSFLSGGQVFILTVVAIYCGMTCFTAAYNKLRSIEGLAKGDILLISILGGSLGLSNLPFLLILAVSITIILYFFSLIKKDSSHHGVQGAVPFGPGICCAALILLLTGNNINLIEIMY